jgi:hypothetical protein
MIAGLALDGGEEPLGKLIKNYRQFGERVRLYEVFGALQFLRPLPILEHPGGGKYDDRQVGKSRMLPNPFQRFESIHQRHFQIEQHGHGQVIATTLEMRAKFHAIPTALEFKGNASLGKAAAREERVVLAILPEKDVPRLEHQCS